MTFGCLEGCEVVINQVHFFEVSSFTTQSPRTDGILGVWALGLLFLGYRFAITRKPIST